MKCRLLKLFGPLATAHLDFRQQIERIASRHVGHSHNGPRPELRLGLNLIRREARFCELRSKRRKDLLRRIGTRHLCTDHIENVRIHLNARQLLKLLH